MAMHQSPCTPSGKSAWIPAFAGRTSERAAAPAPQSASFPRKRESAPRATAGSAATEGVPWVGARLFGLVLSLALTGPASPWCLAVDGEAVERFGRANALYSEGMMLASQGKAEETRARFEEAARLYEQILASGCVCWPVLYNLGNVQYRQGRLGKAVLSYRRAERLAPRNADILANLRQAKSLGKDRMASDEVPSFFRSLVFFYYGLNLNEATVLAVALYLAFCGSEILYIFFKGPRLKRATMALLVLTGLSAASLVLKIRNEEMVRSGVIVAAECPIRMGPGEEYHTMFTAHEGADVIVLGERTDARSERRWLRVKVLIEAEERTDSETRRVLGPEGYIPSSDMELL